MTMMNPDDTSRKYEKLDKQRMQKKKKYALPFLLVGIAIGLIATLITCAVLGVFNNTASTSAPTSAVTDPSTEATEPSTEATECYPEKITLTVWAPAKYMAGDNWLANRLDAFQAAHPEYTITWVTTACDVLDAAQLIASNPQEAGDVFFYPHYQKDILLNAGALSNLTGTAGEFVEANFCDVLVRTASYFDGKIYGIPMSSSCPILFYNKDFFTAEDVESFDKMLAKGKITFPMTEPIFNSMFFLGNGCTLFGDGYDTSAGIQFGGQKGYEAAHAMYNIATNSNFFCDSLGMVSFNMMKNGELGAYFSFASAYDDLYATLGDKLGVAPLPTATIAGQQVQLRARIDPNLVGVNHYTQSPKLSAELAIFLASEESQLLRYRMQGVTPTIQSLASHPEIKADMVASAEMTVINNSVMNPPISAMQYFGRPLITFGEKICIGINSPSEIEMHVDQLDQSFNSIN